MNQKEYLSQRLIENMRNAQHRHCRIGRVRFKRKILPAIFGDFESVELPMPWWMQLPTPNQCGFPVVVT